MEQDKKDEDFVEFVTALHEEALKAWTGIFQNLLMQGSERKASLEEGKVNIERLKGTKGSLRDIIERLVGMGDKSFVMQWQGAASKRTSNEPTDDEPPLTTLTSCVGLLADIARACNVQNLTQGEQFIFAPGSGGLRTNGDNIFWLTQYAHEREKSENDVLPKDTVANSTRKEFGVAPLP